MQMLEIGYIFQPSACVILIHDTVCYDGRQYFVALCMVPSKLALVSSLLTHSLDLSNTFAKWTLLPTTACLTSWETKRGG